MNVGIVGLGLIGGSLVKAFRAYTDHTVLGFDANAAVEGFAQLSDMVHGELSDESIGGCELLILAAYPAASKAWLEDKARLIAPGTLVLDCLGTKARICELGFRLAEQYGFTFVGGHPMAGSERSGIKYARADLFRGSSMVLVPQDPNDIGLLMRLRTILKPLGFERFPVTTAREHDRRIGFTSQLPHLISNALVQCPGAENHSGFSAGSFRDMTRVAELNPRMWTELFLENRENLLGELESLLACLSRYRSALQNQDEAALIDLLTSGSLRKKEIS